MQVPEGPHAYYLMRQAQEREMAAQAADESARRIHLALADKYRELAEYGQLGSESPSTRHSFD